MRGSRIGELARCRAASVLSEEDCVVWFGVGLATLERVEAGEIEPAAELEQRIDRFLTVCGGGSTLSSSALPGARDEYARSPQLAAGGDEITRDASPPAASFAAFDGAPIQSNRGAR